LTSFIGENSAYQEFLEENQNLKIDRYNTCYQISEFLIFKNGFEFTFPKVSIKSEREDLKDFDANQFFSLVQEFLKSKISSKALIQMSQIEDIKVKFNLIQSSILIHEPASPAPTEFDKILKRFHEILGKRINDLTGNEDIEISF